MKKQVSEIRIGTVLSYVNLAIGNIIPLIYTPIMLDMLGQNEYGLYTLAHSVVGYLSLFSFGIGGTIVRYLAKARANNDKEEEARIAGLFLKIYSALAIVVIIVGIAICGRLDFFFGKTVLNADSEKLKLLVFFMSVNTALTFPSTVFSSIVIANERFIYNKLIAILSSILIPSMNLIVLYFGFGSVGMTLISTMINIGMCCSNAVFCFKSIGIYPKFSKTERSIVREIAGFSAFIFLDELVGMLFWATDKVLIGSMIGTAAVAIYNIGATFSSIMQSLGVGVSSLFAPRIVLNAELGNNKYLNETFVKIGRIQYYIIALILTGFVVFGRQFIDLWVGADYSVAYYVALVVMVPLSIPIIQSIGYQILVAKNKHKFRAVVYFIIAIFNVIATAFLIPNFGIVGAAVATSVAYFIGPVFVINWYYYVKMKMDIVSFWKSILKNSRVPIVLMTVGLLLSRYISIRSWTALFIGIAVYTLLYSMLCWKYAMNGYEKELFQKPVKRLLIKFKLCRNV